MSANDAAVRLSTGSMALDSVEAGKWFGALSNDKTVILTSLAFAYDKSLNQFDGKHTYTWCAHAQSKKY